MPTLPYPKTIRAKEAEVYFGIKRDFLNKLVAEKKVLAYCDCKAVFYDFASIDQAIHSLPAWDPKKGN